MKIKINISSLMTALLCVLILFMQIQVPSTYVICILILLMILELIEAKYRLVIRRMTIAGLLLLGITCFMYGIVKIDGIGVKQEFMPLMILSIATIIISFGNKVNTYKVILFLFWSSAFFSILGMLQYHLNVDIPFFNIVLFDRLQCGYNGPNELANANSMIIGLTLIYHMQVKKIKYTFWGVIPLMLGVVFSWSRAGFVILSVAIGGAIAVNLFQNRKDEKHKLLKKLLIIVLSIVLVHLFANVYLPEVQTMREGSSDRDYIFDYTMERFKESPIYGHGLGYTAEANIIPNDTPHNEYYLFLINGGIIGLGGLLIYFLIILNLAWNKKKFYILYALMLFLIVEFTFNNLVRYKISILFYVLLFLVNSTNEKGEKKLLRKRLED